MKMNFNTKFVIAKSIIINNGGNGKDGFQYKICYSKIWSATTHKL